MTETREVTKDVYRRISDQAHDLFQLINDTMNDTTECGDEWSELHDQLKLAGVIASIASRAMREAPDPDAPVPYLPAPLAGPDDPRAPWGEPVPQSGVSAHELYEPSGYPPLPVPFTLTADTGQRAVDGTYPLTWDGS